MARSRKRLGEILVGMGAITVEQADKAAAIAKGSGKRLGETLVEQNFTKEDQVAKALANQFGMEYVDLSVNGVTAKIDLKLVPDDLVKKHLILPLGKTGNRLQLLIHDPMDLELFDLLRFRLNVELDQKLTSKGQIKKYLEASASGTARTFGAGESLITSSIDKSVDKSVDKSLDKSIDVADDDAPIVKLCNRIIAEALVLVEPHRPEAHHLA